MFLHTDLYVALYLFANSIIATYIFFSGRAVGYRYEQAVIYCAFTMMGWSLLPCLITRSDFYWFFEISPPKYVSRWMISSIFIFSAIESYRVDSSIHRLILTLFSISLIVTCYYITILNKSTQYDTIFFFILFLFFMLAGFVSVLPPATGNLPRTVPWAILSVIVGLGLFEFMLDLGPIRNFFRGMIETRSLSTFHNPNWFCLCIAPVIFVSTYLCLQRMHLSALFLAMLTNLGIIISGSRSVFSVLYFTLTIFILVLFCCGERQKRDAYRVVWGIALSNVLAVAAGLLLSLMFGAYDRFYALLVRLYLWPVYFMSDRSALESIRGRVSIEDGFVIDNAYLYMFETSKLMLVTMLMFSLAYSYILCSRFMRCKNSENALRMCVGLFLVLVGFTGQVYWAFPVWPVLAITAGLAMRAYQNPICSHGAADAAGDLT